SAAYPDQYERNERYLLSVGAETKGRFRFTPLLYWQRNYDNFELTHGSPVGENFHMSQAYGLKLGGNLRWWGGQTAVAAEVRQENILSTNLGTDLDSTKFVAVTGEDNAFYTRSDHRTILSYSLEHNILLHRWTISVGVMASMATSTDHRHRFYPGADIAYRPATGWKLYVNYNKGFRLPSFTELYYKSPTHEGNKTLQPEENHSLQVGAQYQCQGVQATLRGFYHIGNNIIDWVMYHPEDNYHSTSFTLDNMGVQASCKLDFTTLMKRDTWVRDITLGYTFIHQKRHDDTPIYRSNYALEYLRHKLVATLHHRIWSHLTAHWSFRWQDRMGGYLSNGTMVPYSSYP
ncbi:MAG: TonB-dependent receptor, partial [Bacteroidaceae bacterium]|nr:TonB-dependent receptor [Bacteroidaceae bacterium]